MNTVHTTPELAVNIDFHDASVQWRANKKRLANGCYRYICMGTTKMGKPCNRTAQKYEDYCKNHFIQNGCNVGK